MTRAAAVLLAAALVLAVCAAACAAQPSRAVKPRSVRGEAVVLLLVPDEIRRSDDRRALFAAYCREVAADAGAEPVYVSPVYESSECVTATFRSEMETEELLARLKKDPRVAGASPNYIMSLPKPHKTKHD